MDSNLEPDVRDGCATRQPTNTHDRPSITIPERKINKINKPKTGRDQVKRLTSFSHSFNDMLQRARFAFLNIASPPPHKLISTIVRKKHKISFPRVLSETEKVPTKTRQNEEEKKKINKNRGLVGMKFVETRTKTDAPVDQPDNRR